MSLPVARFENLVIQELADEVLICDTNTNRAFCLNRTSAEVWKLCDGETSTGEIATRLSAKFGSPVSEQLVWLAIDQLAKENLLQKDFLAAAAFGGLSRREVIRRIGTVSVVALPVISSLVLPTAAHAQSSGGSVSPVSCGSDTECSNGTCCDTFNSVCVTSGSEGCICSTNSDCTSGCCSDGVCSSNAAGSLGCSCFSNFECDDNCCSFGSCSPGFACEEPSGEPCTTSDDCPSGQFCCGGNVCCDG